MKFNCAHCGKEADKPAGAVNRAQSAGLRLFCGRRCSGLGRRDPSPPTKAERVTAKRAYDMEYRRKNRAALKAKKAERHKRTYDPVKAAVVRKKRMPRHVEYCGTFLGLTFGDIRRAAEAYGKCLDAAKETDRLRAALEKIADDPFSVDEGLLRIARNALAEPPSK